MSLNTDTTSIPKNHKAKAGDVREKQFDMREMDAIDKKGRWSPPGGRELLFHSHLSDAPGEKDSDGLEEVLEPANVAFVDSVLSYDGVEKSPDGSFDADYIDYVATAIGRLLKAPRTGR